MKAKTVNENNNTRIIPFNGKNVVYKSLQVTDVKLNDYPDFSDAYVDYGEYDDGTKLTDEELEKFTEENGDIVNELAFEHMHGR